MPGAAKATSYINAHNIFPAEPSLDQTASEEEAVVPSTADQKLDAAAILEGRVLDARIIEVYPRVLSKFLNFF